MGHRQHIQVPSIWKATIARARAIECATKKVRYEWTQWGNHFLSQDHWCSTDHTQHNNHIKCPFCNVAYEHTPSILLHIHREHGHARSTVRDFVTGTRCFVCLKEHHTQERLTLHLHNIQSCLELTKKWHACSHDRNAPDHQDNAEATTHTGTTSTIAPDRLPAFRVPGPLTYEKMEATKRQRGHRKANLTPDEQIRRYLGDNMPTSDHETNRDQNADPAATANETNTTRTDTDEPPATKRRLNGKQATRHAFRKERINKFIDTGMRLVLLVGKPRAMAKPLIDSMGHNVTIAMWEGPTGKTGT